MTVKGSQLERWLQDKVLNVLAGKLDVFQDGLEVLANYSNWEATIIRSQMGFFSYTLYGLAIIRYQLLG